MTWFRRDLALKVASLVLALFLWMYMKTEARTVQVFQVPLELADLPPELAFAGDIPDSVAVRIRASDSTIQTLSPARFQARASLASAREGAFIIPLTADIVRAPFGVEVLRVDPPELQLEIRKLVSRELPIVPRIQGVPAAGFEVRGQSVSPETATIEGPEGIIGEANQVWTQIVDIEGRKTPLTTTVSLLPDRAGIRIVGRASTNLKVEIAPKNVARMFEGIQVQPFLPEGTGYNPSFEPATVAVTLEGPQENLDRMSASDIAVYLDLEGMGPRRASYTVRPRVVISGGGEQLAVKGVSPATIEVKISK